MVLISAPVQSGDQICLVSSLYGKYMNVDIVNGKVTANSDRQFLWIVEKSMTGVEFTTGTKPDKRIYYGDTIHLKSTVDQKYVALHQSGNLETLRNKAPGPSESFALMNPLEVEDANSPRSPEQTLITHLSQVQIQTIYGTNILAEKDGKAHSAPITHISDKETMKRSDEFTIVIIPATSKGWFG
ncbi:hypothetical protein AKO1_002947 [Acrasis kona]|uniref:Uncharacterized protein n=1 Tax=Acrasis kona TaxID=1008807 RepID=A0AAW2Z981_9EUKA